MKQIKVFKIDFPFEDVQLSGVCRWIENSVQVEMLQPYEWYDGIKFFKDKEPLTEQQVRKVANEFLIEIYHDLVAHDWAYDNLEECLKATKNVMSEAFDFQERVAEAIPQVLEEYADGNIDRHEYLKRLWLISHAIVKSYEAVNNMEVTTDIIAEKFREYNRFSW